MTDTLIEECPGGCNHLSEEHFAFDLGVADGVFTGDAAANPYTEDALSEAWLTGHSVGVLNQQAYPCREMTD